MKINAKKLRVLFVDDEDLEKFQALKSEGYDVEHWRDIDSLDNLCDGRFHVVFLDVRGIGGKYDGNGLDVLKYVATHNPLIFTCILSAKPFTGEEAEVIRRYASRSLIKDGPLYDLIEVLENYASTLTEGAILERLQSKYELGFIDRWKLKRGRKLSESRLAKLAKASKEGVDAVKILSNMVSISVALTKIIHGVP